MAQTFGSSGDEEVISGINVTPLVDVVLVLLIIFMITAPVIYQSTIKVQLPKATTGDAGAKSPLSFTISREGNLFWGNNPTDWTHLSQQLKDNKADYTQETASISADKETAHGVVIRLMDTLREAGITKFALNVESSVKYQ